jgi:hypothetical protein
MTITVTEPNGSPNEVANTITTVTYDSPQSFLQ